LYERPKPRLEDNIKPDIQQRSKGYVCHAFVNAVMKFQVLQKAGKLLDPLIRQ